MPPAPPCFLLPLRLGAQLQGTAPQPNGLGRGAAPARRGKQFFSDSRARSTQEPSLGAKARQGANPWTIPHAPGSSASKENAPGKHHTSNPQSSTLTPKPYTLNELYTLDPKPWTLAVPQKYNGPSINCSNSANKASAMDTENAVGVLEPMNHERSER